MRTPELSPRTRTLVTLTSGSALTLIALARPLGSTPVTVDVLVGWAVLGCGISLWRSQANATRAGTLMAFLGLAWLAGAAWPAAGVVYRGPLAHLLLAWPGGRLAGSARPVVALAYVDGMVESIAPSDALTLGYGAATMVAAIARLRSSSGLVRRGRLPATAGALATGGFLVTDSLAGVINSGEPGVPALLAYQLLVAGIVVLLAADARWGAAARGVTTGLVVELGSRGAGSLQERLATVLGDPTLVVAYARDEGRFVDASGRPVSLPPSGSGRTLLPVRDRGEIVAVIVHDAAVIDDEALAGAVGATARIAVANTRLRAEIDERARALDASQRRLLSAADDQRRAVERRLADGALAGLGRIRTLLADPAVAAAISTAPVDVRGAVEAADAEVRAFARGVYPPMLESDGLAAAVTDLASGGSLPVEVTLPDARLPVEVETTAYFVCAEALANAVKHARASRITVEGTLADGELRLVIADDGIGGADPSGPGLRGLGDRVAAVGGTLHLRGPAEGGTAVVAEIPLGPGWEVPDPGISRPA